MLAALDKLLMDARRRQMKPLQRGWIEFLYFGFKNARSCLFVFTFMATVVVMPRAGLFGIPRYDLLLIVAALIAILVYANFFTHHYIGDYRGYLAENP